MPSSSTTNLRLTWPARPGEQFAPGTFERNLGQRITITVDGREYPARILAAEVTPSGRAVDLELEVWADLADAAELLAELEEGP